MIQVNTNLLPIINRCISYVPIINWWILGRNFSKLMSYVMNKTIVTLKEGRISNTRLTYAINSILYAMKGACRPTYIYMNSK